MKYKTFIPKKEDLKRFWYLIDAKDKVLGRVASRAAVILRGKHKAVFTPHLDTGDGVIIINASRVRLTGNKPKEKLYRRYSGYPGGLKEVAFQNMLANKPATVVRLAVSRMLPKGSLSVAILKKLKVYAGDLHPHKSQNPKELDI